jgi:sugar-specific transcriptional regulator TrmB
MLQETLGKTGLTTNEAKVYLALIELGSTLAGDIAKKADLHRRPTYDALNRLVEKGLVTFTIKAGKKFFQPISPERISELLKEKEREFAAALPQLLEKFKRAKIEIISQVYEGKEGVKSVMEDVLRERKEWLSIGSTGKAYTLLPFYLEQFARKRVKLGIKRKVLIAPTKKGEAHAAKLKKQGLAQVKFIPKQIRNPQTVWVYNDKVVIILVSLEHPVLIMIQNKDIAKSHKDYFEWLWKNSYNQLPK